jgi:hypothetical protein
MTVTVVPETFSFVFFDAAEIARVVDALLDRLGLGGIDVVVEVDESTPVTRVEIDEGTPLVLRAGSGALEDTRMPRTFSEVATQVNLGRLLLRRRDRASGAFVDAPADHDLGLAALAAWDVTCVGRLSRMGIRVHEPRWRYNLRNRLGFSDVTDATFDRLWALESPTWSDITAAATAVAT